MVKRKKATKRAVNRPQRRQRKKRSGSEGVLNLVHAARREAGRALVQLRGQISETRSVLDRLLSEERDFIGDLSARGRSARPSSVRKQRPPRDRGASKRGPAKADKFFAKLPRRFGLEEVRRVAGRLTGVSLAQWSRAKKIRKVGNRYAKVAAR